MYIYKYIYIEREWVRESEGKGENRLKTSGPKSSNGIECMECSPYLHTVHTSHRYYGQKGLKTLWRAPPDWYWVDRVEWTGRVWVESTAGQEKRKKHRRPLRNRVWVAWWQGAGVWNAAGSNEVVQRAIPRRARWWRDAHTKGKRGGGKRAGAQEQGRVVRKSSARRSQTPSSPVRSPPTVRLPTTRLCRSTAVHRRSIPNHPFPSPYTATPLTTTFLHRHRRYYFHFHDLPKIQFGFYPSKKLYNGYNARGQNPIPGKLNNLKHIIIRMKYYTVYTAGDKRQAHQVIPLDNGK